MHETPDPHTQFDWAIYADATFAGLSALIPIPLVDLAFEWLFRRRMPKVIARRRGRTLGPAIVRELNRGRGCWQSCLTWPVLLLFEFLKSLSKKILYFLAIKEASDQLSYYWHRAFLLDYMLLAGYLTGVGQARQAAEALDRVLDQSGVSPLNQLAHQIVASASHVFRTLRRARRGKEDEVTNQTQSLMARAWDNFDEYFEELAAEYDQTYQAVKAEWELERII